MKRYILLAISLSIIANASVAQDILGKQYKKFIFGYNYGSSLPKGDFLKTNESKLPMSRFTGQDTTRLNGYAQTGIHYDIYFIYRFLRHIGVMVAVSGDQNNYNINTLNSQYIEYFPPNTVAVTTGDNYYIEQYLIGPYINISLIKNLSIEIKVLAGPTTANYPALAYLGLKEIKLLTSQQGSSWGYNLGTGINYTAVAVGDIGLGLHLNINYIGSTITYPSYTITNYTPSNVFINSTTYTIPKSMSLNILQVTFGISFEL